MLDAAVTCSKQIRSMKTVNPNVIAYAAIARKNNKIHPYTEMSDIAIMQQKVAVSRFDR